KDTGDNSNPAKKQFHGVHHYFQPFFFSLPDGFSHDNAGGAGGTIGHYRNNLINNGGNGIGRDGGRSHVAKNSRLHHLGNAPLSLIQKNRKRHFFIIAVVGM